MEEEDSISALPNINQPFLSQRGRGRFFSSRGRGFHHTKPTTSSHHQQQNNGYAPQSKDYINGPIQSTRDVDNTGCCQICGKLNHTADHAFQPNEIPKALAAFSLEETNDPAFYDDSGASSHIVNDPGNVTSLKPYNGKEKLYVGNDEGFVYHTHRRIHLLKPTQEKFV